MLAVLLWHLLVSAPMSAQPVNSLQPHLYEFLYFRSLSSLLPTSSGEVLLPL